MFINCRNHYFRRHILNFLSKHYRVLLIVVSKMNFDRDVIQSKSVKTQKIFFFDHGTCHYQNIEVDKKNMRNELNLDKNQVRINNNVCAKKGSSFIKVTEIYFGDKFFSIQDVYDFSDCMDIDKIIMGDKSSLGLTASENSCVNSSGLGKEKESGRKKKIIFKQKSTKKREYLRRNTKNVSKNFYKAFQIFLSELNEHSTLSQLKSLNKEKKYNNSTILKIVNHPKISPFFRQFLNKKAENWINHSKIQDKQIHIEAITLFKNLFDKDLHNSISSSNLREFSSQFFSESSSSESSQSHHQNDDDNNDDIYEQSESSQNHNENK